MYHSNEVICDRDQHPRKPLPVHYGKVGVTLSYFMKILGIASDFLLWCFAIRSSPILTTTILHPADWFSASQMTLLPSLCRNTPSQATPPHDTPRRHCFSIFSLGAFFRGYMLIHVDTQTTLVTLFGDWRQNGSSQECLSLCCRVRWINLFGNGRFGLVVWGLVARPCCF